MRGAAVSLDLGISKAPNFEKLQDERQVWLEIWFSTMSVRLCSVNRYFGKYHYSNIWFFEVKGVCPKDFDGWLLGFAKFLGDQIQEFKFTKRWAMQLHHCDIIHDILWHIYHALQRDLLSTGECFIKIKWTSLWKNRILQIISHEN